MNKKCPVPQVREALFAELTWGAMAVASAALAVAFRSWRDRRLPEVLIALCLAFFAPLVSAQETAAPPNSGDAQLRLAEQQGDADTTVLDWVLANSGPLKGDTRAKNMRVAFTITPPEGWWDKAGGGKLAWHPAPAGNVHLRIFVLDLADGRQLPNLDLRVALTDANGNEQPAAVDFGWYPLLNAYGGNVPIPADSSYTLRVTIAHGVSAEFSPVPISLAAVAQLPLATAIDSAHEAELLKPGNAALAAAITALWQHSVSGAEKPDGDYFAGYALDAQGAALPLTGSKLHSKIFSGLVPKTDVRLALLVRDSRTGRIIPGLKPQASLVAADDESYGPGELSLTGHPWLTHYAGETRIPRKGLYTLHVHFDAPGFRRWGQQSGRFAASADVEFDNIALKTTKPEEEQN